MAWFSNGLVELNICDRLGLKNGLKASELVGCVTVCWGWNGKGAGAVNWFCWKEEGGDELDIGGGVYVCRKGLCA